MKMKRIFVIACLFLITPQLWSSVKVTCDVIYKNEEGEWSDFRRTDVTFCLGKEINELADSRTVFAILYTEDYKRVVLKMVNSYPITGEWDDYETFLFCCSDMINQGLDFKLNVPYNEQEWKIYPKDEHGLLIDKKLGKSESGRIYNDGVLKKRSNGITRDRVKPKDEPKHIGELGTVVYKDNASFYIIKTKNYYIALERNDYSSVRIEKGDIMIGNYAVSDEKKYFYNQTRDIDRYRFTVLGSFYSYEECLNFIKSKWPVWYKGE